MKDLICLVFFLFHLRRRQFIILLSAEAGSPKRLILSCLQNLCSFFKFLFGPGGCSPTAGRVQSFYITNEMCAILSTALRLAARNTQCNRPDRPTVLSCAAARDRSQSIAVCGGRSEWHWAGHCRLLQLSPVTDNAALLPSAVDPRSRP